jgi:ligand-binding sensor domain-containing protein
MNNSLKVILLLLFLKIKLFSQTYSYRVYDNKEGFDSPETTTLFIDSRGFIWIGGVDGITRFDGKKFINFNKVNGLVANHITSINEGKNGDLFLGTLKGISIYNGNSFNTPKIHYKDTLTTQFEFHCIYEASNHKIYAGSSKGLFVYDKQKNVFEFDNRVSDYVNEIIEDENNVLHITTGKGLVTIKNNVVKKTNIDAREGTNSLTSINIDFNRNLWIGSTQGIINCNKHDTIKYFTQLSSNNYIQNILVTADSSIVFTSSSSEIRILKNNNFKTFDLTNFISKAIIKKAVQDNQGNIWLATSSGLVKMYHSPLNKYFLTDTLKLPIASLAVDANNNLYLGSINGLVKYDGKNITYFNPSNNPDDLFISALTATDSFLYVGTYSGKVYKFDGAKFQLFDTTANANDCVYKILPISKNEFWFCKGTKVVHYKNNKVTSHFFSFPSTVFTQSALLDHKGDVWFANLNSLSVFKNDKFIEMNPKKLGYDQFVTVSEDKNRVMWVGTYGNGLLKFDGVNFTNVSITNGLCNNFISSSYYDELKNVLWIGTMNGISKINLDSKSNISSINNFVNNPNIDSYGCVQNAIQKLPNGNILFSVGEELYEYDYNNESKTTSQLKINLQGIKINYEKIDWQTNNCELDNWANAPVNPTLSYDKNNISFDFIAIDYNNPHTLKYTWKLDGYDEKWSALTENNFASYTNLPSGDYILKVKALNQNGVYSNELIYTFKITPPFYKTWWFVLLTILSGLLTISLFIKERIAKIKREEASKTENYKRLAEVELKAMRAQMNPHFMFNTLNSIQEIVLNKDDKTARIYLADFALMMRMILENSTQKAISLEKELEFITLYLNLEQLRFENKFKVTVTIPESLNSNSIKVPPMLIQPYIENAIIHGLMHKIEDGILNVSFEVETIEGKEFLKCTVYDNGVGRKKSAEFSAWKERKHQSMATEITNERLQLLNNINEIKGYNATITDLENDKSEPLGTRVEIYIPLN